MKLKAEGTSIIGIFHDLEFMEGLCDEVYNIFLPGNFRTARRFLDVCRRFACTHDSIRL